jgi:hypothetical protein
MGITAGNDGCLWFVEAVGNKIGRITLQGIITEAPIPTPNSSPTTITKAANGDLWFTETGANQIGHIHPPAIAVARLRGASAILMIRPGMPFDGLVAKFTDPELGNPAGSYTVTIAWGDNTTSTGTVTVAGPGRFFITGSHVYAAAGNYTIAVTVTSADGRTVTIESVGVGLGVASQTNTVSPLLQVASDITHSTEHYSDLITAAYEQYLNRPPESQGFNFWLQQMVQGLSDESLEASFIGSAEYIANHGGTGAIWVQGLYLDLLGRDPAQSEVAWWLGALANGMTSTAVAHKFATSPEREGQRITEDYWTYLDRLPEPGVVDWWVQSFQGGISNEDVSASFVGSPEYFADSNKGKNNDSTWVQSAYIDVLERLASQAEINAWVNVLQAP